MELGLTLGGGGGGSVAATSSSTPLNKSTDLALALGVKSNERHHPHEGPRSDGDPTVLIDSPRLSLDLLPRCSHRETANTGSREGGLPGAAARGFDVNRARAAGEEGKSVSSPNSVASAFQVDFCIFGGGAEEEKREWAEAATGGGEHLGEGTTSSRASEEDENGHTRKKLRLSKEQAAFLEESFKEHNTLNPKQKQALAKILNLRPRQVEVWFQNRRARTKLKQTEVDCEYLKRCCETLTQENRRLHKELQELRALKSSNPYNMQLPATTLTMCPACKRTSSTPVTATSSAATGSAAASNKVADSTSKPAPFPLSRPKFFPFSSHNNQPQKSAAS